MRTILLPGLGADADLFRPQRKAMGQELTVVAPTSGDLGGSFTDAAQRVYTRLEADGVLDEPYVLGGMSFGGSLAIEIARVAERKPDRLMLIASNRTSDTIPRRFRIAKSFGGLSPKRLAPSALRSLAGLFAWREGLDTAGRAWLGALAERVDLPLLLWGAEAIAAWRFSDDDAQSLGVPIFQIHGRRDWVLPFESRHVTMPLDGARHLINWTHAMLVNDWLANPMSVEPGAAAA